MKAIALLILVFLTTTIRSQTITREQATAFSDSLIKYEFLSPNAKNVLLKAIDGNYIEVEHPSTVKSISYTSQTLSKETVLQFCLHAIATELSNRFIRKGTRIENKINPKEPLDDSMPRPYAFNLGFREEFANCISPKTSVIGYTRQKSLTSFLRAGLIDEKIFNDCQSALQAKQLADAAGEAPRVSQGFHKGVNKWLTEVGSPYRLFTLNIRDKDETYYGIKSVGLLLLKQGEDSLIINHDYFMSSESFETRFTRKNIDTILGEFQQYGFFSHLSPSEIDSARQVLDGSLIESIDDIFLLLPKTVLVFDWEMANLENPYEEITREFEKISRGNFRVTDITDDYKKARRKGKQVKYGFTMNGKRYEKMLNFEADWMDPEFVELIQSALSDNKVNGRFYYCIDNGQESGYIFLTDEQYQFIRNRHPGFLKRD